MDKFFERGVSRRDDVWGILDSVAAGIGLAPDQVELLDRLRDRIGICEDTNIFTAKAFLGLWHAYYARPGGAKALRGSRRKILRELAAELDAAAAMAAIEAVMGGACHG